MAHLIYGAPTLPGTATEAATLPTSEHKLVASKGLNLLKSGAGLTVAHFCPREKSSHAELLEQNPDYVSYGAFALRDLRA